MGRLIRFPGTTEIIPQPPAGWERGEYEAAIKHLMVAAGVDRGEAEAMWHAIDRELIVRGWKVSHGPRPA